MSDTLPPYPHYNSAYTYEARNLLVCPKGGHEWNLDEATTIMDFLAVKDAMEPSYKTETWLL